MTDPSPIRVRTYGEGPGPVVVLHGGPGAPGCAASLAKALANEFEVHEPWQRMRDDAPLSVARHVEDLRAVAPEHAVLVGWSWGAMLALSYASAHPERVRGIALVGCGTYDDVSRTMYREAMQSALGVDGRREASALKLAIDSATDETRRNELWATFGELMDRAQTVESMPEAACQGTFDAQGADETWQDALRLQAEGIEPQRFASITCPVLMLHGNQDPHPGPATRDLLKRSMPQLAYVAFDRCGHEPWRERHAHEAFFAVLRDRLRTWCD